MNSKVWCKHNSGNNDNTDDGDDPSDDNGDISDNTNDCSSCSSNYNNDKMITVTFKVAVQGFYSCLSVQ